MFGICLKVWGELASFNRPEMKVERVSYDVMTPSAARGILEAIHWKPEIRWVVDRIHVLAPIRFTQVRRNEIDSRIPVRAIASARKANAGRLGIDVAEHRQQRAALLLRDVSYGIAAHVLVRGDAAAVPEAKHLEMFKRRARKGQYFHHPYLGCREFPASFELMEGFPPCSADLEGERDLGFMLHDVLYVPDKQGSVVDAHTGERVTAEPRFFRAVLRDGILAVPPLEATVA